MEGAILSSSEIFLAPVFGTILSAWLVPGEGFNLMFIAAIGFVAIGIIIMNYTKNQRINTNIQTKQKVSINTHVKRKKVLGNIRNMDRVWHFFYFFSGICLFSQINSFFSSPNQFL